MASPYDWLYKDQDLDEAYKYAQLQPHEQIALRKRQADIGAERGFENLGRGLLGLEPSSEQHRTLAGQELRELAKQVTPGTPEFYKAAVDILRKHSLVAEAEEMQKRLHALELGKGEMDPTLKLQRAYDELQKRFDAGDQAVKPAMDAMKRRIDASGVTRPTSTNDPEFLKLLNAFEAAVEAGQGDRAEMIKRRIDAEIKAKETSGQDVAWARLALAKAIEDRKVGTEDRKVEEAEAHAARALQNTARAIDQDSREATRLLQHPGLVYITGQAVGLGGRVGAALSSNAAGARAILLTVHAQTFLRALNDLRAASKNTASGLGQLTEKEGDKIQNAKVALDTQQPTEQFKRTLADYIQSLENTYNVAVTEAAKHNVSLSPRQPPVVDASVQADPRAVVTPPAKRTFKATKVTP